MYKFEEIKYIEVNFGGRIIDISVDAKYYDQLTDIYTITKTGKKQKKKWIAVGGTHIAHQTRSNNKKEITYLKDVVYRLANPNDSRIDDPDYIIEFLDGSCFNLTASNIYLKKKLTLDPDYERQIRFKEDKAYYV